MHTPDFWFEPAGLKAALLAPLGCLYAAGGKIKRKLTKPYRAQVPVICIGNLIAGGAGKTPVVQALASHLQQQGKRAAILLRGYGGRLGGPLRVDPARHTSKDVGDEALLHATLTPTWISADRAQGARAIASDGADIILMDDGFQNTGLYQDLPILVIDGATGFGNQRIIPAGPLREPLEDGLKRAMACVLIGEDKCGVLPLLGPLPVFKACIEAENKSDFGGKSVVAFAGIGRPQKFFDSLNDAGARIAMAFPFPDHHAFTECEIEALLGQAKDMQADLVTTAKDFVRLPKDVQAQVKVLKVRLRWNDENAPIALLNCI
jgi:tetraacyldisaccharide 4'-kinase